MIALNLIPKITHILALSSVLALAGCTGQVADTTAPVITRTGAATINLDIGDIYTEQGAICSDNFDADKAATVGGASVVTTTDASFIVTYNCTDTSGNNATQVTRTVNVGADITAPIITLTGAATISILVGSSYIEQGAICNDNLDASKAATVGGATVVTTAPGLFIITYNCTDTAGNSAIQVTRLVNVTTDNIAPVITRTGAAIINLTVGGTYTEQGAICNDNINASKAATVGGATVVTTAVASFTITYNCVDSAGNSALQVTRTVNVTAAPDITPPVITRTGAATINLVVGNPYTEQGAICNDNSDASKAATVGGPTVVTTAVATFIVTYNCTDSSGNIATQVTRTVNVTAAPVYGLTQRPLNTTCVIPDPPVNNTGYTLTRVFPNLSFSQATALRQSPVNANRWYVAEHGGLIRTFLTTDTSSTVFANLVSRLVVPTDQYDERGLLEKFGCNAMPSKPRSS